MTQMTKIQGKIMVNTKKRKEKKNETMKLTCTNTVADYGNRVEFMTVSHPCSPIVYISKLGHKCCAVKLLLCIATCEAIKWGLQHGW